MLFGCEIKIGEVKIMLGFPKSTELSKQLPKKAIYEKFNMNAAAKNKFDYDIKKILIVNEVSPLTTNIVKGENISSFYVLLVTLKKQSFDEKNIAMISKMIKQNMLFVLEYDGVACLAIYHTKLINTKWQPINDLKISIKGLNFDAVWENIIVQIGGINIEQGNSLDEQIQVDDKRKKLNKQITSLEKLARTEKQPRRKFEIFNQIKILQSELEGQV